MKTLKLETGTVLSIANAGEKTGYPIASIQGSHGSGWFDRYLPETSLIVHLAAVDAISAGFAVPIRNLFIDLDLCDRTAAETTIATLETEIARLERKIVKLEKAKR
jgi:hypothetical protein